MSGTAPQGLPPETPATGLLVGTDPQQAPLTYADLQMQNGTAVANSNSASFTQPQVVTTSTANPGQRFFTEEDVARIRREEKDKLYGRMSEMEETLATLQREREEREKALQEEAERRAEEERKAREEEMSAKQLLEEKDREWQARFQALEAERERQAALLEQERKFNELIEYRRNRIEQESDSIMPELRDLVGGNSIEEVEASIEAMKARTAMILASIQGAVSSQRQQFKGASVTAPPVGPMEQQTQYETLTPEDIRSMDLQTYAKNRDRLMQAARASRGR